MALSTTALDTVVATNAAVECIAFLLLVRYHEFLLADVGFVHSVEPFWVYAFALA